jgi:hypothetical protein
MRMGLKVKKRTLSLKGQRLCDGALQDKTNVNVSIGFEAKTNTLKTALPFSKELSIQLYFNGKGSQFGIKTFFTTLLGIRY